MLLKTHHTAEKAKLMFCNFKDSLSNKNLN